MKNKGLNIALMVLGIGVAGFVVYKLVSGKGNKNKNQDQPKEDLGLKVTPDGLKVEKEDLPKTDISKLLEKLKGKPSLNVSDLTSTKDSTM